MKALAVNLFSCFVQISVFIRSTESQFVNSFGFFYGNSLPSRPNSFGLSFGGFSDVAQDIRMGQNCQIASFCKIASGCSMGDNVRVSNYVQVGQGASIGSNCQIMDYASLGPYVKMGENNMMNQYAQIQQNADIGIGCIMGMHANVGPNTKLERNVYAGDYCQIGSNAAIGENSVIQPYAVVPDNGYVGPDEMVIKTPTTPQLYQNCLPVNQIQQADIELVNHGQPENLNERVRQLMSSQKEKMESNCQGNAQSVDFEPLGLSISLYLIRYDGLEQFIQNMRRGFGSGGVSEININPSNGNDKHFVEGSPKKFLEPELENDMVEMLALKEDSQRSNRVPGDTFCKTVSEVQNKQKKVKCDQAVNVSSPGQNVPATPIGRPQIPSQVSGNGDPVNKPPQNNYQPNIGSQQPFQPNQSNPQPSQPQQPNQGYSNNPNGKYQNRNYPNGNYPNGNYPNENYPNEPKISNEQPTTNVPNYSITPDTNNRNNQFPTQPITEGNITPTPSYSNNQSPTPTYSNNQPPTQGTQETYQPTSGYHSNSYASTNSIPIQPRPKQPNSGNSPNCNQCNIQPDTSFGANIEFGNNLNIGKSSTIGNNCKIKDSANVGDSVVIGSDSVVSENANIGSNCILDDKSKVGPNAKIEPGSYLGKNCDVGANAFVGENAIILDNAKVPDGGYIESNNIVIPTPTSADLYSSCAPIQRVPQNLISQPDPNNNLRQMMREQVGKVRSHCQQQSQQLLDFATFASAKTIYLLSFHGIPGFSKNIQNVQYKASGNGDYDANAYEQLMNEEHFIDNGQPNRIEPDVKGEMIILIGIEQDYARGNRSPDDSFCQTFLDIASNQRRVKCDK